MTLIDPSTRIAEALKTATLSTSNDDAGVNYIRRRIFATSQAAPANGESTHE